MKKFKKILLALLAILIIGGIYVFINFGAPSTGQRATLADPADTSTINYGEFANQTLSANSFMFEGYSLNHKANNGNFETITVENEPVKKIIIDTNSLSTSDEELTNHLCAASFINCAEYPHITFTITEMTTLNDSANPNGNTINITGNLELMGVTRSISFDATNNNGIINADFFVNTRPFGFSHFIVDSEVRIVFEAQLSETVVNTVLE